MKPILSISRSPLLQQLFRARVLTMALAISGCVPATAYEQANSAAQVEREGHRLAAERLASVEQLLQSTQKEKQALLEEKSKLQSMMASEQSELAQVALDREVSRKETEHQSELVNQLRGELARVGEHIKQHQEEKASTSQALADAEKKLAEKDRQMALLRAEIESLKRQTKQGDDENQKLASALEQLDELGQEVASPSESQEEEQDSDEVLPSEE